MGELKININPSSSTRRLTLLLLIFLQSLTMTVMSPISSLDSLSSSNLDLLLDPVFQTEQDNLELESKRVVPKSVYNTVIRVTSPPSCQPGTQRAKEGGPCVTKYGGAGPV